MVLYRPPEPIKPIPTLQPEPMMLAAEEQPQKDDGKAVWVGAPDAPGQADDGISDLFEVGNDDDTSDLVNVDIDRDIIDTNERGSLDDLTEVSTEDIMGDEETGQIPLEYSPDDEEMIQQFNGQQQQPRYRLAPKLSIRPRYTPPTSAGGMRG